jgi:tripeptidyl-peptidase-1
MLSKSFLALAIALSPLVGAVPNPEPMVVHNSRSAPPSGYVAQGSAPVEQAMNITIALVSSDMPGLEKALMDVSTPTSANYRKFLSKEEVSRSYSHGVM